MDLRLNFNFGMNVAFTLVIQMKVSENMKKLLFVLVGLSLSWGSSSIEHEMDYQSKQYVLKSGKEITGVAIVETSSRLVVEQENGEIVNVEKEQLKKVNASVPLLQKEKKNSGGRGNGLKILAGVGGTLGGALIGGAIGKGTASGDGVSGISNVIGGILIGSSLGSSLAVYGVGSSKDQGGGLGGTLLGSALGGVAGVLLAAPTVGVSLLFAPAIGATIGYNLSDTSVEVGGVRIRDFGPKNETNYQLLQVGMSF